MDLVEKLEDAGVPVIMTRSGRRASGWDEASRVVASRSSESVTQLVDGRAPFSLVVSSLGRVWVLNGPIGGESLVAVCGRVDAGVRDLVALVTGVLSAHGCPVDAPGLLPKAAVEDSPAPEEIPVEGLTEP